MNVNAEQVYMSFKSMNRKEYAKKYIPVGKKIVFHGLSVAKMYTLI